MRTFLSHGVASLPPMRVDEQARTFTVTLSVPSAPPSTVQVAQVGTEGVVRVLGRVPRQRAKRELVNGIRHVLRLDEDLSGFYALAAGDPALAWVVGGAGRMIRSPTLFEDVVKTICTTNCAWSATKRMVGALVEHLGERMPGAPESGVEGRAFPTAGAMAAAGDGFYRDVARAGYRGPYLKRLATSVAEGSVDLEALGRARTDELSDTEVAASLQQLPGVGPYAAAHIMMVMGRYSRLILDSWTRPKYAALTGRAATDASIARRFRRYGRYAGLAFWLFLTQDWVEETPEAARVV